MQPRGGGARTTTMGPRYEVAPVGQVSRRRLVLVGAAAVAIVGLALAKPWAGQPPAAVVDGHPTAAGASGLTIVSIAIAADPSAWPAQPSPGLDATDPTSTTAEMRLLVAHAGTWGVGDGGSGPRLTRDTVWIDWTPIAPGPPATAPDALSAALGSGSCTGLPTLFDRPSVLAVTASADIGAGWRVTAWWSHGGDVLSISGSVRQVVLPGQRAVAYLERLDEAVWPDGRYELHVTTGHRTYALSVCVEPSG